MRIVYGVTLRAPSALTWNRALPLPESYQFPEEIPAAGKHDPSTPRPSTLPRLSADPVPVLEPICLHLRISSIPPALTPSFEPRVCTQPRVSDLWILPLTSLDVVLHAPVGKPLSPPPLPPPPPTLRPLIPLSHI